MNSKVVIASIVIFSSIIIGFVIFINKNFSSDNSPSSKMQGPSETKREIVQYPINPKSTPSVGGSILPEFTFDLSEKKFQKILTVASNKIKDLVDVKIVHEANAITTLDAEVITDGKNKKLMVKPSELVNFRPGLYHLSLKLRTLEGEVDLVQDFTWGVIAVNTKKSIYSPNEKVLIGLGVLDDGGQTQCLRGFNHVTDLSIEIINPAKKVTKFSIKDGSIRDSGKCGETTITNEADFQSEYTGTSQPGIYQIKVTANVKGKLRSITDYFKVDPNVKFDVERTSFPTRIFPKSIYPNTFTITSKEDFTGEVSDIVPGSFEVKNISGNGKRESDGDFIRIKWYVTLKANTPMTFTYFINFPPVSPEFYLLGPIKLGNFIEARQWQIASDAINSTSGLVAYEDNGGANTYYNIWTGTSYNTRISMSSVPGDSRWFREVSSPKTGEKIVALIDNATNDPLNVFTWSGTAWTLDKDFEINSSSADVTRPFDIAYEDLSGDALFLYSDYSNAQLRYYKRVAGVWDAGTLDSDGAAAGTAYDTYKRWVRLEPQLNSDSILAGYLTNNERVGAMIWDGASNSFGDQFDESASTITATSDEQAFDIAWETNSGTPMIFWGTTGNLLTKREFTGGTWQAEATVTGLTGFTNDLDWVFAASDPVSSSNNISLALQDGGTCDVHFAVWEGSSADVWGTSPACPSAATNNLVETAFENDTGQAMFVYVPDEGSEDDNIAWLTWTSGGGFVGPTTESQNIAVIESLALFSDLNTTSMMLLFHDNSATCDLYSIQWDGTSWSVIGTAIYNNMCASADDSTLPYGFGFDRNLETLAAYRWFVNSIDLGGSMTAHTTQDTPYTLTTEHQVFRLRMLLYYPDSLLSSAARQYKLQYVDPGTGTCIDPVGGTPSTYTDVPSSGGSTISFYNNGTLVDGDNIATSSADPTYQSKTRQYQDYEESNNFTNSRTNMAGDQVSLWDFALIDNTAFDRVAQNYCFRVARENDLVLRIGIYPQISTAAVDDVLIQGETQIDGGTSINNP